MVLKIKIILLFINFQEIIPDQSNVKMLGTKVEITLRKAEPFSWSDLEFKPVLQETNIEKS